MDKNEKMTEECCKEKMMFKKHHCHNHGSHDALYGLGVIGASFYFLKGATTIGAVFMGIGKAIFWPAILMFKLLTYLRI